MACVIPCFLYLVSYMKYFVKTPWWLKKFILLIPGVFLQKEKIIYLTFDDGPHPEITPFVLKELKNYNALATFFVSAKTSWHILVSTNKY